MPAKGKGKAAKKRRSAIARDLLSPKYRPRRVSAKKGKGSYVRRRRPAGPSEPDAGTDPDAG